MSEFKQRSDEHFARQTIDNFKDELADKPHFEEMYTTYITAKGTAFFLQILSAIFACALVAYPAKHFLGNWWIGVPPAIVLLVVLEVFKYKTANLAFRKIVNKKKLPILLLISGVFISSISITLSTIGNPLLVEEISPPPTLQDTSMMAKSADIQIAALQDYWLPQINKYNQKAKDVHAEGNHDGKIHGRTKDQKYQHEDKESAYQDSLNKHVSQVLAESKSSIANANKENTVTVSESEASTSLIAFWTAIGTFLLELVFYILSYFCVRFKKMSILQDGNSPPSNDSPQSGGNTPNKKRRTTRTKQEQPRIETEVTEEVLEDFFKSKDATLNKVEREREQQPRTRTKQEQPTANIEYVDVVEENITQTEQSKVYVINKDVNHGKVTEDKDGNPVIYYIKNKGKGNEEVKYYSVRQVKDSIRSYTKRVKDARGKVAMARTMHDKDLLEKRMESLTKNVEQLGKWKGYLGSIQDYKPRYA